jgi:hypothetical protein
MCWTYMQKNWKKIESIYGQHDSHLIHFIEVKTKNSINAISTPFFSEYTRIIC